MSKLLFTEMAMRHGLRAPEMIELAEAAGLLGDLETQAGREASLARFKAAKPQLFGPEDMGKSTMELMSHARFGGMSDAEVNTLELNLISHQIDGFAGAKAPEPEKPVSTMTAQEAADYQNRLVSHFARASMASGLRAELQRRLGEFDSNLRRG